MSILPDAKASTDEEMNAGLGGRRWLAGVPIMRGYTVNNDKMRKNYLTFLISYIFILTSQIMADEPLLDDVIFRDIKNIAIGAFNLKADTYLFSIPKDNPPSDRGLIWGEMFIFEYQGKKYSTVSIFNCGPITSHLGPYMISFSEEDKYLLVESGGESGSVIDVFVVSDLFIGPLGKGWNGTDTCVKPIATLGGYRVPVTFHGWKGQVPLVKSSVPLNQVSTSVGVIEYEKQGKCCDGETQIFAWDILTDQFTVTEAP